LIHINHKSASNLLPKGAAYNPNSSLNEDYALWYTGAGATSNPAGPVGTYWLTDNGGDARRIFAANTAAGGVAVGDLAIWVDPGGIGDAYIMVHVLQYPDAS
jgi:hypothetical protein